MATALTSENLAALQAQYSSTSYSAAENVSEGEDCATRSGFDDGLDAWLGMREKVDAQNKEGSIMVLNSDASIDSNDATAYEAVEYSVLSHTDPTQLAIHKAPAPRRIDGQVYEFYLGIMRVDWASSQRQSLQAILLPEFLGREVTLHVVRSLAALSWRIADVVKARCTLQTCIRRAQANGLDVKVLNDEILDALHDDLDVQAAQAAEAAKRREAAKLRAERRRKQEEQKTKRVAGAESEAGSKRKNRRYVASLPSSRATRFKAKAKPKQALTSLALRQKVKDRK